MECAHHENIMEDRRGKNTQLPLPDLLRQSIYSRLAGYEDLAIVARHRSDLGLLGAVRMKLFHTGGEERDGRMIGAVFEPKRRFVLRMSVMNKTLATIALIATLALFAAAQDSGVLPPSGKLPFCPPKTCLYYAGDFDYTAHNANGVFNANDTEFGIEGQVWVGVKPPQEVTVTGSTFNQLLTSGFIGTNPTPFQTQIGITSGNAGEIVCDTSGTATIKQYGESDYGLIQYSYTIKKLKQPCKMQPGSEGATYVNLLPTSGNGYGYLVSAGKKNHRGWKNDYGDCYSNSSAFGDNYTPLGSGCEFSIALTGTDGK
jgi:hypothetical protein